MIRLTKCVCGVLLAATCLASEYTPTNRWYVTLDEARALGWLPNGVPATDGPPASIETLPGPLGAVRRPMPVLSGRVAAPATAGLGPWHQSAPVLYGLPEVLVRTDATYGLLGVWDTGSDAEIQNGNLLPGDVLTADGGTWQVVADDFSGVIVADFERPGVVVRSLVLSDVSGVQVLLVEPWPGAQWKITLGSYYEALPWECSDACTYSMVLGGSTEYRIAAANCFLHAVAAERWARAYLPGWQPLNYWIIANDGFLTCNAFYMPGPDILAFGVNKVIGGCANAAYSTVIWHELGHGFLCSFHENPVTSSCADPAWSGVVDYNGYHEAVADTFAGLGLNTSCMGLDFFGDGKGCGRDIDEDFVWPIDDPDPHVRGRPLSGAYWDLAKMLAAGQDGGSDIADFLFLVSISINQYGYTPEIVNDLLAVDKAYFDGAHALSIKVAFALHGLIP